MRPFDYVMGVIMALVFMTLVALLGMHVIFWQALVVLWALYGMWSVVGFYTHRKRN